MELLKDLSNQDPALPLLVLSTHDEVVYARRSLRAGARGMRSPAWDHRS
jgi:DNA-binding NarL/FixJ family response regulator